MSSRRDRRALKNVSRRAAVGVLAVFAVVAAGLVGLSTLPRENSGAAETPVTVYAAGDLGGSASEVAPVANIIKNDPATNRALLLGDICYPDGTPDCYPKVLDPTYGPIRSKIIAAPGNHDYHTTNGSGFFGYFPDTIPRAWDVGNGWTVITYNTEVSHSGGSAQEQAVKALADAAHAQGKHVIAITHHPRYTGGSSHGDDTASDAIVADLDAAKADVVLAGHNHIYERFQPMGAGGALRGEGAGIRFFTVGTGGNGLYSCTSHTGRVTCDDSHHGALRLHLFSDHYEWAFVTTSGQTLDAGSAPTRTGGVPPSTTSSTTSPTTSSSTSTSTSTLPSTTSTTTPTGCADHTSDLVLTSSVYLHVLTAGCWDGGIAWDTDPTIASWDTFHRSAAWLIKGPGVTIRNTIAVNFGDSYQIGSTNAGGWLLDHVQGHVGHDDLLENDRHQSGTLRDSRGSSFVIYSDSGEDSSDGSGRTVLLERNHFHLRAIASVYKPASYGTKPGVGTFFKLDSNAARLWLQDNTFVAENLPPSYGSLGPPPANKLAHCDGNTIVWKGAPGAFPATAKLAWASRCTNSTFIGA